MAENSDSTSSTSPKIEGASTNNEVPTPFSIEDLEKIIDTNDPEFQNTVKSIAEVGAQSQQSLELIDLDQIMAEQESKSFKARWRKLMRYLRAQSSIFLKSIVALTLSFVKEGLPKIFRDLKQMLGAAQARFGDFSHKFKYWPLSKKLGLVGVFFLTAFLAVFIHRALTHGVIPEQSRLFVNSMDEWASHSFLFDPQDEMEFFYDSMRVNQNIMALKRVVVNLKKSPLSGGNPMAAFEFYLEGNSSDVVIELKDREYEVVDLTQRLLEEMTFNELDSIEGKQSFLEKLRKELNSFLTRGKIRKIFIKNAVVKP